MRNNEDRREEWNLTLLGRTSLRCCHASQRVGMLQDEPTFQDGNGPAASPDPGGNR